MSKLTIAIPTYNRNALVLERVRELLPQLTPSCVLLVLDNCSPEPVQQTLQAVFATTRQPPCTVIRHPANIGGNANIMRCLELCETEWLWILGDDDPVNPNAVATILATVAAQPDLTYVSFGPAGEGDGRAHTFMTAGLREFAAKLDRFGHCNFISACLYNASKLRPWLGSGYAYGYSCAPHTLMVLLSLGETGKCLFSVEKIVRWETPPPAEQPLIEVVWLGFMTILEARFPADVRRSLGKAIFRDRPALRVIARELYHRGKLSNDFATCLYRYDHLTFRLYYFERSIGRRVHVWLFRLPLAFPRAFALLSSLVARLTDRDVAAHRPASGTE